MIRKKTIPGAHAVALMPAVVVLLLAYAGGSAASEPTYAAQYSVQAPAQPLADSLRAIAHETSTSVLFDPAIVRGRMAHSVAGKLTALEAITAALEGTGLHAEQTGDSTFVVKAAATPNAAPASGVRASAPSAGATVSQSGVVAVVDVKQAESPTVTRVEITGTRLKRINAEGPAPVNVYTAKDIEQSGQPSLERFLAGLNEASVSAGEGTFGATLGQGTVQLRGLPLGTTLVLINGRRVEAVGTSSANFFNLNLIPLAAIERVEVVPVGSSAVYGGDALAGVVNVILKKAIDGISLSANLGSGRGFGDGGLSLATGGHNNDGSYLVLGSYSRATPLTESERGFFVDADYTRFGGNDARVRNCTPGTVSSVSGGNLPGLNASFAAIPKLADGQAAQISDFTATAGTENLCNRYANANGYSLVHGDESLALHATGEHSVGGSWVAFGEFTFVSEKTRTRDVGLSLPNVTVSATNPFNPFGEDVKVTALLGAANGLQGLGRQTRFTRAMAGLRGGLAGDWETEFALSTVRDDGGEQNFNTVIDRTARLAALAASSTADALNPFTTGRAASDAVLRSIWSDGDSSNHGRKDQVSALARGSLVTLPAGAAEAVVGVEGARDHYVASQPDGGTDSHAGRRDSAVYGELRVPLLTMGESGKSWNMAAITIAARRDRYSDFGAASTYQTGFEMRPARSLLLRASSATSFKPPTLLETHITQFTFPAEDFSLIDPARGGESITSGTVVRTTNKSLKPERGRANSIGALWEPEADLGTRLGATWWQVRVNGLISVLEPQAALDHESLFPGFVMRGPAADGQPGAVTSIINSEANFGSVQVSGADMEAAYAWRGFMGRWTSMVGATRTNDYEVVLAPGAAKVNRLGRRYDDFWAPRWKTRASIVLDTGTWSVGLTSRYLGRYRDEGTSERRLGAYWTHDLSTSLDLKKAMPDAAASVKGAALSLNVANLLNHQPQFVESLPYYDVTQADWRGRYVSTRVSIDW